MGAKKIDYGYAKDGTPVDLIVLENEYGMRAEILTYGAILKSLFVPDKSGNAADVVLGYDSLEDYYDDGAYFGATVGRCANRIENASFVLNGKKFFLEQNEGKTCLHSGNIGYNNRVFDNEIYDDEQGCGVSLFYYSPNGDQGFPGNLEVTVTYILTDENSLIINYSCVPDEDTVINLTNHSYFNLSGHDSGSILDDRVMINSDKITFADEKGIADGREIPVSGTPFDFTDFKRLRDGISDDFDQIKWAKGYDRNFCLRTSEGKAVKAAVIIDDSSGRVMEVWTDLPGLQMYTGNYIGGLTGKGGCKYHDYDGVAFEAQFPPNAINIPSFPQPVTRKNERYEHVVVYKFTNIGV